MNNETKSQELPPGCYWSNGAVMTPTGDTIGTSEFAWQVHDVAIRRLGIAPEVVKVGQRAIDMARTLAKRRCSVDPTSGPRCEEPGRDRSFAHIPWCGPCESRRIIDELPQSQGDEPRPEDG